MNKMPRVMRYNSFSASLFLWLMLVAYNDLTKTPKTPSACALKVRPVQPSPRGRTRFGATAVFRYSIIESWRLCYLTQALLPDLGISSAHTCSHPTASLPSLLFSFPLFHFLPLPFYLIFPPHRLFFSLLVFYTSLQARIHSSISRSLSHISYSSSTLIHLPQPPIMAE